MMLDQDNGDKSQWLPDGEPIITKERAAKGDIITGKPCEVCQGNGRDKENNRPCKECRGRGWNGIKNAAEIPQTNLTDVEYARAVIRNILNYLWQMEYITQEHYDAGHTFNAWRDQHRVARGLQRPTSNDLKNPTGVKLRAHGYILLTKRLRQQDYKAISDTIEITATEHVRSMVNKNHLTYYKTFDRLCIILSPIKEQIEYLESLTDEQREFLSEEKMKIAIAQIRNLP